MISPTIHRQIAAEIQHLIAEEQYSAAQKLLPDFTQAVVEICNSAEKQAEFEEAREFLKTALLAIKARRSHYLIELERLQRTHDYLDSRIKPARTGIDVTG